MRKIGIGSILIITIAEILVFILLNYAARDSEFMENAVIFLIFYVIIAVIFFKIVVVNDSHIKIYRPLWFLFKRNSIIIPDVSKVIIRINNAGKGGSVGIEIYDREGKECITFLTQLFKFEIKKLVKQLNAVGVVTELEGSGAY